MRRATPSMPVTPALLRHFAVLTIAITSCIAVFAQGESHEHVQQQAETAASKQSAAAQLAAPAGKPKIVGGLVIGAGTKLGSRDDGYFESDSGGESGGGGGGDGDGGGSGSNDTGYMPNSASGERPGPQQAIIGPAGPPPGTPGAPRSGPPQPQAPRRATGEEMERMLAASRERSGAPSSE